MKVTRIAIVVGILFYVLLWVIAANGASSMVEPLAIPLVLAVLVAGGVALNRFMGIAPRRQHFKDRDDESDR